MIENLKILKTLVRLMSDGDNKVIATRALKYAGKSTGPRKKRCIKVANLFLKKDIDNMTARLV